MVRYRMKKQKSIILNKIKAGSNKSDNKKLVMKNKLLFILFIIIGMVGCEDTDVDFPDYHLRAVYFPVQTPLRTLSLGEDRIDNSLDREYKFDIGVSIGGMYENNIDWTVDYVVDQSLTDSVYANTTPAQKIRPLPQDYYTFDPENTVIIPKGSFNGRIRVELTDKFFDDTLAVLGHYVIPLRITGTSADSILSGLPVENNPNRTDASHWEIQPKDWVMFGIKYVNAYHGSYLHRGRDVTVMTESGDEVGTTIFRDRYRERDPLIWLTTIGRKTVVTNGIGDQTGEDYSMVLEFDNDKGANGNITVKPFEGSPYEVTGSGQYFDKETSVEQWSLITWQSMYLSYSYDDGIYTHNITDTLVFRSREISYEEFKFQIRMSK
jgi:hypothetical protein